MRGLVVVLFAGLMLAGCAQVDPPEATDSTDDDSSGTTAADTASGSVTVQQNGNGWIARRTETASGPFSAGSDVTVDTVNGAIAIDDGGSRGFHATASLWARGDTKEAAKASLAKLSFLVDATGGVDAEVRSSDGKWSDRGGSVTLRLATGDVGDVEADTTNGAVEVEGLRGDTIVLDTTNGRIDCDVAAATLELDTTNGAIDCTGTADDATVETTNGPITLDLRASSTGAWEISTSNGAIDLTVTEDAARGYDVQGETTNGGIDFAFDDTYEVSSEASYGSESRHERTNAYEARTIQTQVTLDTTNGAIEAGS